MLNQDLLHTLNQRIRYIQKHLNECLKVHGLYHAQWTILFYLTKYGASTQTELSSYFHVEAPTITRTVKRMELHGWIVRETGMDKREKVIVLTDMAKRKYVEIEKSVSEHEKVMLSNLSQEEKESLLYLLQKIG
ncbi:MarR family winged helix-turn-helix transcriptional regulator [Ornithinibacillus contaminans]|uniref:MarR family winged helix-turn-helix transcriptional regulator n=1 Tax=Ornithinibacillus contaminans TaxID=694055 RepID=UPI00064DDF69|nr:MarR family transcriptional regulator [Ornithinibacillus contaminans]